MSTDRLFEAFRAQLAGKDHVENGMELLKELVVGVSRDLAEVVFFRAQTTEGITQEGAQRLANETMLGHGLAITETLHNFGGTLDMVLELTEAAGNAYGARLAELATSYGQGGAA